MATRVEAVETKGKNCSDVYRTLTKSERCSPSEQWGDVGAPKSLMILESIRLKIAVAVALLCGGITILFAVISIAWFSQEEQSDLRDSEPPTPAELRLDQSNITNLAGAWAVAFPFVICAAAAGAWLLAGTLSRPLRNLADAAEGMDARSLHARLPVPKSQDEIARLIAVLNNLLSRLERSFHQASRFAADASHELRTPLAIMRGEIENAIQEDPCSQNAALLTNLLEQNQRLSAVTEKLLLLARADAGHLLSKLQPLDLSAIIQDVADDFQLIAEERSISVRCDIMQSIGINGDEVLIRQVLLNLFDNALKYNTSNGWIHAQLERTQQSARFIISNSGSSIPSTAQNRLFERFFRAELARDRESGGAGLGLSLSSEIAVAHGGRLQLLGSDQGGTRFLLELPGSSALSAQ